MAALRPTFVPTGQNERETMRVPKTVPKTTIDTPIQRIYDRTPRELLILCGGLAMCFFELTKPTATNPFFLGFYVTATVLFALRFFPTRVAGIGMMVSCLGLPLLYLRYGAGWTHSELWWGFWAMLPGLVLLLSSDLRATFDRGPKRSGWRTNHWRDLPRHHWMISCWLAYLTGVLINLLMIP